MGAVEHTRGERARALKVDHSVADGHSDGDQSARCGWSVFAHDPAKERAPMIPPHADDVPLLPSVQALCQRTRQAGSPNGRARPALVTEYADLCRRLDLPVQETATGRDLQRAAATLLRAAADADRAAAQTPRARLRRVGLG